MSLFQVDRPYATSASGEIGATRDQYHYYNPEGAAYVQDRWEHEGMVLNLGLRYDIFSVGQQIPISEVQERVKRQFSPRVGIAYPISDRDVFSFHYGRFYQIPDRQYIFDNRDVFDGRVRGNPNLSNETTVSYQAGIQHLFSELVSGQFSVYYKDIFGLVTTDEYPVLGSVGNIPSYVNKDYASARGFETTLSRGFGNNFSGGAELRLRGRHRRGVATRTRGARRTSPTCPISEQPLDWDMRHTFRAQLQLAKPGNWGTSFVWQFESGFPYTPIERNTRQIEPEVVNSRRMPARRTSTFRQRSTTRSGGSGSRSSSRAGTFSIRRTSPTSSRATTSPARRSAETTTRSTTRRPGRAGGAYVGEDQNGDGIGDLVPVNDPRVFGDPRSVRVGVSFSF